MNETTTTTASTEAKPKQWISEAGPIQTRKVKDAFQLISSEGKSYTELSGVIGVQEHRSSYMNIFGGLRQDAIDVLNKIGEAYEWRITRGNYTDIIGMVDLELKTLEANRPVKDSRRTADQVREETEKREAATAERESKDAEKRLQVEARAAELRLKYPWALGIRNGKSESAGAAACLKEELIRAFPGIAFRVRSDYSSINCHWDLGPTWAQVKEISDKYQNSSFDGQTDSTDYDHSVEGEAIGAVLGRVRFVSISRDWPEGFIEKIAIAICAAVGVEYDKHKPGIIEAHGSLNDCASDHAYQLLNKTTFAAGETFKAVELCQWTEGCDNDTWHWCKIVTEKTAPSAIPPAQESTAANGAAVRRNMQHNGVEVEFPAKPEQKIINQLKAAGFRWSKFSAVWYKKFSPHTWEVAHAIVGLEAPVLPSEKVDMVDRFDMAVEDQMAAQCGL